MDNGSHLKGEVRGIIELYNIEHHKSSPYWLKTNGAIETTNKNIRTSYPK